MNGSQYTAGQEVHVYSNSHQQWMPARVEAVHSDGRLTCKYHGSAEKKDIPLEQQTAALVRPASHMSGQLIKLKARRINFGEFKGQSDFKGVEHGTMTEYSVDPQMSFLEFAKIVYSSQQDPSQPPSCETVYPDTGFIMNGQFKQSEHAARSLAELGLKGGDTCYVGYGRERDISHTAP
uniref:Uncharacterized protein n=1 Tax=Pyrodinium bahamense TaxID=73915 RepID=A0A7S0A9I5_9DINO|mmetsp:Transcript_28087/g.77303  ORF Transcript_28087/g.77303 Transcript_28087/m.77303 type:complete len:179 (+) Transcript_28087:86-622(+)